MLLVVILYSRAPEFMSKGFLLLTRLRSDAPKYFIKPVTHRAALPMQPSRRHFVIEMTIQLHLSILVAILVILPNYSMINYDYIVNLSSGESALFNNNNNNKIQHLYSAIFTECSMALYIVSMII